MLDYLRDGRYQGCKVSKLPPWTIFARWSEIFILTSQTKPREIFKKISKHRDIKAYNTLELIRMFRNEDHLLPRAIIMKVTEKNIIKDITP